MLLTREVVNGTAVCREEESWYRTSLELVRDSVGELHRALALLERDPRRTFELRFIRDLFVFTKCEKPEAVVRDLRNKLNADAVDVFNNGVKVYIVPRVLSKGNAVVRFREYIGAGYVIAAGDSEFDIPMLEVADLGIAPPDLAQRHHFSERVRSCTAERHYAEAVLSAVLEAVQKTVRK